MKMQVVRLLLVFFIAAVVGRANAQDDDAVTVSPQKTLIVVTGAGGEEEFGEQFASSSNRWKEFAEKQNWRVVSIGSESTGAAGAVVDRELLKQSIESAAALAADAELWLVMIGHGTFAANVAKFNLVGPDVSATELNDWLKPVNARTVVLNCSSSSGPFITALAGRDRIVVTATRSGAEQNYSRFGSFLADSVDNLAADLDHDQEVSLLEAFLSASSQTERFYREDARLATEHALLDDNGDRVGTSGDFYRGVRPTKAPAPGKQLDGRVASRAILFSSPEAAKLSSAQVEERQQIEEQIDALRARKSQLNEAEYLEKLEVLCLEMARVYRAAK